MTMDISAKGDAIGKSEFKTLPIIASFLIAGFVGLFSETALNMALNTIITDFAIKETTVDLSCNGLQQGSYLLLR